MKFLKKQLSLVLLLPFLILTFLSRLDAIPLRIWDEARNANNALYMYLHGNWLVPFYEGKPDMWNTKPPLLIWLQVFSMHLFGVNDVAARIPSALGAVLTGLFLWWFCKKILNLPWLGFLAGAVLAATFAYVCNHGGRSADYDPLLVFFMLAYSLCFFIFITSNSNKWLMFFWIFLTLAVMTKGIVGLMLLPGIFVFTLARKKLITIIKTPAFYSGMLLFLFIVAGYYLLREKINPGYLKAVYQNELGGRYLEKLEGHYFPFWYYTNLMWNDRYLYWFWFVIPSFIIGFIQKNSLIKSVTLFNSLMVFPFWLIISAGQTKLDWYDLPLYPFLAIQIAILLYCAWQWAGKIPTGKYKPAFAAFLFILLFSFPFYRVYNNIFHYQENEDYINHLPGYFLKYSIKKKINLDGYVVCFEGYNGQIDFYIQQLRLANNEVRLQQDVSGLVPGNHVVINQQNLAEQLQKQYAVTRVDEKYGCSVYLVQSRL